MESTAPATLITPAGTINLNQLDGRAEYYLTTDVQGLTKGGSTLRAPIDPNPQTDGGIVHDFLKDVRHVTVTGQVIYIAAASRNSMCLALEAALESIEDADGTYSWTWTGQSLMTLTVRCDQPIPGYSGSGFAPRGFVFGLVAAIPAIV